MMPKMNRAMLCEPDSARPPIWKRHRTPRVPLSQNNIHPCCHKCFGALVARSRKDSVTGRPTSGAIAFMVDMPEDGAEINAAQVLSGGEALHLRNLAQDLRHLAQVVARWV